MFTGGGVAVAGDAGFTGEGVALWLFGDGLAGAGELVFDVFACADGNILLKMLLRMLIITYSLIKEVTGVSVLTGEPLGPTIDDQTT